MSEKVKTSDALNSNFELKFQKQDSLSRCFQGVEEGRIGNK